MSQTDKRGEVEMRCKYRFISAVVCFLLFFLLFPASAQAEEKSDDDYKREIAQFHYSVMNEDGYITCAIDVTEQENGTFKLDVVFKENIHGINLGFYVSPNIIQFMEDNKINYDSGFVGSYLYTIGSKTFDSLDQLSLTVSQLPFFKMVGEERSFYGEYNLEIWDEIREQDNFVDDIYKTNKFLFSYRPLKKMETNADQFENGVYAWKFEDGEIGAVYATQKKSAGLWIAVIVGVLIFGVIVYIILFGNPLANFGRRKKDDYDDYYGYYSDDDYYY